MTPRERVRRTLDHLPVDRAPRDLWALPGVTTRRRDELTAFYQRFPCDFAGPHARYGASHRARGAASEVGEYVDEWGSLWRVLEYGVIGEVIEPPLADWAALADYQPPWELLDEADFSRVDASCAATDHYVRAGTYTRPWERLQFLRGSEQAFLDLAWGEPKVWTVLEMIHEFSLREMNQWAATDVDGIGFMDDWGTQTALLIAPDMWRDIFKPMYRDYCAVIREAGKDVWFHSDGHITAIYPDLIEIGVTAQNSQLFCMDIEALGEAHRGQITFWGEIDRQRLLPFGTPDECRAAVQRVRRALDHGSGGVIAQCEWGKHDPAANVWAVFEEWERPLDAR